MATVCYTDNTSQQNGSAADAVTSGVLIGTTLEEADSTTNFSSNSRWKTRDHSSDGGNKTILVYADLSPLAGATINSATLYGYTALIFFPDNLYIHRLLVANTQSQATWDNRQTSTAWNTGGALGDGTDRNGTAAVDASSFTSGAYQSYDLTSEVSAFAGGTTNYGWMIEIQRASDGSVCEFDSELGTDGQRPELLIDYTPASGGATLPLLIQYYG